MWPWRPMLIDALYNGHSMPMPQAIKKSRLWRLWPGVYFFTSSARFANPRLIVFRHRRAWSRSSVRVCQVPFIATLFWALEFKILPRFCAFISSALSEEPFWWTYRLVGFFFPLPPRCVPPASTRHCRIIFYVLSGLLFVSTRKNVSESCVTRRVKKGKKNGERERERVDLYSVVSIICLFCLVSLFLLRLVEVSEACFFVDSCRFSSRLFWAAPKTWRQEMCCEEARSSVL